MIAIEEIPLNQIQMFWDRHIRYLVDDGIISDEEDIAYFTGDEYRGILEAHMRRETDRHHMVYFTENRKRIGAASYCIYHAEDGKCFILDFWVFPAFRGNGTGHRCFEALAQYAAAGGAKLYKAADQTYLSLVCISARKSRQQDLLFFCILAFCKKPLLLQTKTSLYYHHQHIRKSQYMQYHHQDIP